MMMADVDVCLSVCLPAGIRVFRLLFLVQGKSEKLTTLKINKTKKVQKEEKNLYLFYLYQNKFLYKANKLM